VSLGNAKDFSRPSNAALSRRLYPDENNFRSHVHMVRHGFGNGEYRSFKFPLSYIVGGRRYRA
jgi:hypothetical protein